MSRRLIRYILGIIFDNFEDYVNKKDKINISYNISDLVLKKYINTRIILFDGTGDLTFKGSERFKLLTFKNKYSSPVNIEKFENHLDRKIDKLDDSEIEGKILENTRELHNIISSNSKTLIVTWMNLRSDEEDSKKKKSSKFQITSKYLNEDLRLPEIYSNNLRLIGHISDFEIIHYMSGLDKATNQFRDYDSIVFLGKFRVPNYVVGEFNREYRTGTDIDSYSLYQLVQAITRTRIRNHNGDPINIYFSNDWDDDMINLVKDYLSNEHIEIKNTKEAYSDMLNHIKPKWRKHAEILMKLDENLKDSILRSQNYYFEIELSRLYKLIPMKEKQVRSYYPMINYFRRLGIEINIIVDKENNNQYTVNREE
jgi:predicted CopG family antitoxin